MASKRKYWRSFEELGNPELTQELAKNEFGEEIPVENFLADKQAMEGVQTSRRDFLKLLGFSTAAVTLAACEAPVIKSIPYVVKPDDVTPGVPTYYATTLFDGMDYANVLVKTREGRPIKIDSNDSARYFGQTKARVQAAVLSLYDSDKAKGPILRDGDDFRFSSWSKLDGMVTDKLKNIGNKKIVILSSSVPSPSTKKLISDFTAQYPTTEHVVYDAVSYSPALDAAEEIYGERVLPFYELEKAGLVVSFNANFLEDYNGGGMNKGYSEARKPGPDMLRHIQLESNLSMTGANADTRFPMKQSGVMKTLAEVYKGLTSSTSDATAQAIVAEIKAKGSKAVVMAEGNKEAYKLAYAINNLLGSEAVSQTKVNLLKQSNDTDFENFLKDAKAGKVGLLMVYRTNPVYTYSDKQSLLDAMNKIDLKVVMAEKLDETMEHADALATIPNGLESWDDIQPITGVYSLQQPTIQRIFDSRQFQDSLLTWMTPSENGEATEDSGSGDIKMVIPEPVFRQAVTDYYGYLKKNWEENILPELGYNFNQALYNGFNESGETQSLSGGTDAGDAAAKLAATKSGEWELQLYSSVALGDGTQANNPWLQELPDPITRASWDNYITLNPNDAHKFDIDIKDNANVQNGRMQFDGDYLKITMGDTVVDNVPVFIQPGQALGTIGLALGYGRYRGGKVCYGVGVNAYPLMKNGSMNAGAVELERTALGRKHEFACMQMMNTLMGRYEIAREASLEEYMDDSTTDEWNPPAVMPVWRGKSKETEVDIWRAFDDSIGPHFNLSIDMNSCTGCGACIIACQAENNIPVVGKDEMRMSRDMYWLRIDRYYSDTMDNKATQKAQLTEKIAGKTEAAMYRKLIKPGAENPQVVFQPMLCQHCNHAPCETVCPVGATSHGRQGQNMMAYNRCVGTRYCANNCPYKVRRFNWFNYALNDKFDYNMNDDLGRMVLNPDVVVRTRGVMEKCTFCIQNTQAAILKAKKEDRKVTDEEFKETVACAAACPSNAMVFGDINDKSSEVTEKSKDKRVYRVLEEVGTKPNVFYHVKVRNA